MKNTCGIYQIKNILNNKTYIGSSNNIRVRFNEHKRRLSKGIHGNNHLQYAWKKYGETSFVFSVIEKCDVEDLIKREQYWLDNTVEKYNILDEANSILGFKHSEETKLKMSTNRRGTENPFYGKKHSQEQKNKWRETRLGHSQRGSGWNHTDESKQKISEAASKRTGDKNPFFGKKHKPETVEAMKQKLSLLMSGENNPFFGKKHSEQTKQLLSEKLTGRKKIRSSSEGCKGNDNGAKQYIVTKENSEPFMIKNLAKFCRDEGLNLENARRSLYSNRPYEGYLFTLANPK